MFEIFQKISINNPSAKDLNDDVFFDKNKKLVVSIDTYNEGVHFPNFKYPNLVIKKIIRYLFKDDYISYFVRRADQRRLWCAPLALSRYDCQRTQLACVRITIRWSAG